jgi:serine/threonine protein kinase
LVRTIEINEEFNKISKGGGDLYYHWKKVRKFPEKVVQFIAAELVLALSYLHSRGIIYRDLKPQNILLGTDGNLMLATNY